MDHMIECRWNLERQECIHLCDRLSMLKPQMVAGDTALSKDGSSVPVDVQIPVVGSIISPEVIVAKCKAKDACMQDPKFVMRFLILCGILVLAKKLNKVAVVMGSI